MITIWLNFGSKYFSLQPNLSRDENLDKRNDGLKPTKLHERKIINLNYTQKIIKTVNIIYYIHNNKSI